MKEKRKVEHDYGTPIPAHNIIGYTISGKKTVPITLARTQRLYYMTEVAVKPPTFVIFVNDRQLTHFSYTRYIENRIREAFGFKGTPLKFIMRERKEKG